MSNTSVSDEPTKTYFSGEHLTIVFDDQKKHGDQMEKAWDDIKSKPFLRHLSVSLINPCVAVWSRQAIMEGLTEALTSPGQPLNLHLCLGKMRGSATEFFAKLLDSRDAVAPDALMSRLARRSIIGLDLSGTRIAELGAEVRLAEGLGKAEALSSLVARAGLSLSGQAFVCAAELQSSKNLVETDLLPPKTGIPNKAESFLEGLTQKNAKEASALVDVVCSSDRLPVFDFAQLRQRSYAVARILDGEGEEARREKFLAKIDWMLVGDSPFVGCFRKRSEQIFVEDAKVIGLDAWRKKKLPKAGL